jgi:hypothetical protein
MVRPFVKPLAATPNKVAFKSSRAWKQSPPSASPNEKAPHIDARGGCWWMSFKPVMRRGGGSPGEIRLAKATLSLIDFFDRQRKCFRGAGWGNHRARKQANYSALSRHYPLRRNFEIPRAGSNHHHDHADRRATVLRWAHRGQRGGNL